LYQELSLHQEQVQRLKLHFWVPELESLIQFAMWEIQFADLIYLRIGLFVVTLFINSI